ncbi:MAG: PAS domain S-box protein [Balneolales bacterium]
MLTNKHLNAAFDTSPAPMLILSPDAPVFTIREVNKAYLKVTNSRRIDILNKSVFEAFPDNPDHSKENGSSYLKESLSIVMSTKEKHEMTELAYDIPIRGTKDFLEKYWACDNIPLKDENGKIDLILNCPSDITELVLARKKVAQNSRKLQHQQEQYRSLFEQNPDAVFSFDLKGNFTSANESLVELTGYTVDELMSQTFIPLVDPEDLKKVKDHYLKATEGEYQCYTTGMITRTGKKRVMKVTNLPIVVDEKIIGVYGIAKDITDILKTETKLKQEEQRFKTLVQDGSDLIAILDDAGNYKYVSPTSQSVLGLSAESFIGTNALDYIHEEDRERVFNHLSELSSKKHVHVSAFRFRDSQNNWRWIDTTLTDMHMEPSVNGIVANSRDVTDSVENELKLKEVNDRYNNVSKATRDTIWEWDIQTDTILWSQGIQNIFGYNIEDLTTDMDWWISKIHPEDADRVKAAQAHSIKNHILNQQYEYRFRCYDGTYKHVYEKGFMVENDSGEFVKLVGAMQDVTREKNEQQRLLLMESVIENSTTAILILNTEKPDHPIVYSNDAFHKMSGYRRSEILGKSPNILSGPDTSKAKLYKVEQALQENNSCKMELISYKKNGQGYWKSISMIPVKDSKGHCSHYISIEQDITERKKQEEEKEQMIHELTQNNKDLRIFSYITSHNLRAPLANLTGLIQLFDETPNDNKELDEIIEGIKSSTQLLNQTITDLNDVLHVKDNLSVEQEVISFQQSLDKVMVQTQHMHSSIEYKLSVNFDAASTVTFNKAYLESIFLNLVTNAFKYRSPSRRLNINITTQNLDDHIVMHFQDNGVGLNVERHKHRLFGLYQKFHDYPDSKGLGLYLVKSQLEALGGSISLNSEEDKGSVFSLTFKRRTIACVIDP